MSANKKILLVEDDADILESVEVTLKLNKYEVTAISDTKQVCSAAEKISPDVIVMDVMMPAPNGYELCRLLKSNDKTKRIPIILLSARTQPAAVELGFSVGADRYLPKPFLNDDLLKTIKQLL